MTAALAWKLASEAGCDPALVCAICEQESNWDPWAIRWEPMFYQRYIKPQIVDGHLRDYTEAKARAFSWGLMQVMGQTARETGYQGPLPMLCDAEVGLRTGIAVWKKKLSASSGNVEEALQMWNGGGNPHYAAQVLARRGKYDGGVNPPLQRGGMKPPLQEKT